MTEPIEEGDSIDRATLDCFEVPELSAGFAERVTQQLVSGSCPTVERDRGTAGYAIAASVLIAVTAGAAVSLYLYERNKATPAGGQAATRPNPTPAAGTTHRPVQPNARELPAIALEDSGATTGAIEGRVLSALDQTGVPDAELTFAKSGVVGVRTDKDGSFVFVPHEPGAWSIAAVSAPGFLPFAPDWGQSPITVNALPGRRVRGVTVFLSPATEYVGRVVDPQGSPVMGAEVRVSNIERSLIPLQDRYQSDNHGEFHFRAPENATLEARKSPFAPGFGQVNLATQTSHRLLLQLGPTSAVVEPDREAIAGRVLDEQGAPVEGAVVVAENERGMPPEVVSDADGRFTLQELRVGRFEVTASHPGLAPAKAKDIAAGTRDLVLRLSKGGTLRGKVTEAGTGKPVSTFVVNAWSRPDTLRLERVAGQTIVEPDGTYSLQGLPLEKLLVTVIAPGFAAAQGKDVEIAVAPAPPAVADFELRRGARLHGTVVDRATRQPIAGARIILDTPWAQEPPSPASRVQTDGYTDANGVFSLSGLSPGRIVLTVAASGHHMRKVSDQVAPESGDLTPSTIELTPTAEGEEPKLERVSIGAGIAVTSAGLMVARVAPAGGAAAAGLVDGDLLLEVDGQSVTNLGLEKTIGLLYGPADGSITVVVQHASGAKETVSIMRGFVRD